VISGDSLNGPTGKEGITPRGKNVKWKKENAI